MKPPSSSSPSMPQLPLHAWDPAHGEDQLLHKRDLLDELLQEIDDRRASLERTYDRFRGQVVSLKVMGHPRADALHEQLVSQADNHAQTIAKFGSLEKTVRGERDKVERELAIIARDRETER